MLTDSLDIASQSSPQVGSIHNRMTYCFVRNYYKRLRSFISGNKPPTCSPCRASQVSVSIFYARLYPE
ncbi:MAG: hypothetical protein LBP87_10565, partial [Planctomycetaceae bacterium]|nr:hypothetical protein [Planctomycetaceae bacterium]